jgi:transcription termination factor Rho
MHPTEAMEMLTQRLRRTKSNAEFLMSMNMS